MRVHGLSGKPRDAYGDPELWAEDVDAIIKGHRAGRARPERVVVRDHHHGLGELPWRAKRRSSGAVEPRPIPVHADAREPRGRIQPVALIRPPTIDG